MRSRLSFVCSRPAAYKLVIVLTHAKLDFLLKLHRVQPHN